jgi:malto-oligosyltrehalose synthase
MTPRATMRLQFHKGFTFADAKALVPYFDDLGISHLYASPITTARAGSLHGYDVVDPTRVSSELGGEAELRRLVEALHRRGLGLIVDIVPNHMAACVENAWWLDVLRCGRGSRYARSFDIDWDTTDAALRGKVFLPVLGRPMAEVLQAGELEVVRRSDGGYDLRYYGLRLPLRGGEAGLSESLLQQQPYRLGWWRCAGDRINWRRFFDINDLVCLRMEDEETFERVHALILQLYAEGLIDGVRVDHVDGLSDPAGYCRKLRKQLDPITPSRPYLVVEKILLRGETLPQTWQCDGTTGYDFMDQVNAVQHDPTSQAILEEAWSSLSKRPGDFTVEEHAARREIMVRSFSAQLEACVTAFARLAERDPAASELGGPALRRVLTELLVHFPVYRTYATKTDRPASDAPPLEIAVRGAKKTGLASDEWVVDLLHRWFRDPAAEVAPVLRFQQLSAPVAAKSVEDTAFYRYGRLLSRNDVGFDIEHLGCSPQVFHASVRERHSYLPRAMLATATHDHKRGEDVRARLAVMSELPHAWSAHVQQWIERGAPLRQAGAPATADIAMLLQMIVGAWPLDLALDDDIGRGAFAERLVHWQEKALREAKLRSDWAAPDLRYEAAARTFVTRLLVERNLPDLLIDIFAFVQDIAAAGAVNGLAQLLLKLTTPGVPDLYQGTEYWDFSLVDPDNRRPVDFTRRKASLETASVWSALPDWRNGLVKQAIVARVLALRRSLPELFASGSYEPVEVEGPLTECVVAFVRRQGHDWLLTVVPRLPTRLMAERDQLGLDPAAWKDTFLRLPLNETLFDVLSDSRLEVSAPNIALRLLCGRVPVALFSTHRR